MKTTPEFDAFNRAMGQILRADPTAVKEVMEREKQENAATRKATGQLKRGRKPKAKPAISPSDRVSSAKD
jgi:hypothetical protein